MKNCANYGSVTHFGTAGNYAELGGIAGISEGSSSNKIYVLNCLNYGTLTHNGTSQYSCLGGVAGVGYENTLFENCVSGGKTTLVKPASDTDYIGSVVGKISSGTINIKHCYWTSDVGYNKAYGYGSPSVDSETKLVIFNTTTVDSLNSYNSSWSRWFMLYLNGGSINSLNQASLVVTQKHFPDPVKVGNTFMFWCLDTNCNEKYDPNTTDTAKVTKLYAVWMPNNYTITFNYGNGTADNKTLKYNETIKYPTVEREGYTFSGWDRTIKRMPAENIVITALWLEKPSSLVEIVFEVKSMTKEDVKAVLEKYTDEEFTIEKFEVDEETGETTVIIRFVDTKKAEDFVRTVNDNIREGSDNFIKKVNIVESGNEEDFSFKVIPSLLLIFIAA